MEQMLQRILDKLENMEAELAEVKANMATKQELAELKTELEEVKANMATKQELAELKTELEEVKANIATKQDLALVQQAVIETNEIVKKLESKIDNHEQLLTLLSHRSLEHEAAISSIRSILTK
ncbi:hypothetical protein MX569_07640 [Anoxybacillus kestanbolensis]|uniref:hypothetical protein n=1 Tax=Anoxybacillus kestanbolensis TaxID=227476 RepID=UPI00208DA5F5|nr:hypothetical protein [Anoxybacillus kestanbolensis]MCL9970473.1 hypothetical protein [Anoxybacillus kestanbolensis]